MGLVSSYLRYISGRSPLSPWALLYPLHHLSRGLVSGRNWLYDHGILAAQEGPLPVISVGNLTHGGTNKTPMVERLARLICSLGLKPGVVSRGYSGGTVEPLVVDRETSRELCGDEPLMLARKLPQVPVVVSRDRIRGVELLKALGAQVVVADDCFQHRQLQRDLDVVLVDATCPFGNGLMTPAGMLREPLDSLRRAGIVVITKSDLVSPGELEELKGVLEGYAGPRRVFLSRLSMDGWSGEAPSGPAFAFCAIGNPGSFRRFLTSLGVELVGFSSFRDHHRFSPEDMRRVEDEALKSGARCLVCTEKDILNFPSSYRFRLPVSVPMVSVEFQDRLGFLRAMSEGLRPRFTVASNGHGEDSMGVVLCRKLKERLPAASVEAFPLVGGGDEYRAAGFPVMSPSCRMPSGGIVKYSLRALLGDILSGLPLQVLRQLRAWRDMPRRTCICVGDVYLFLNALLGTGVKPVLVATAKTVYLSGHWRLEGALLRSRALAVWTRDEPTREELELRGVRAVFDGSPIMDLVGDVLVDPWEGAVGRRVLVLPGSREYALRDLPLLIGACLELSRRMVCSFLWVPSVTLDVEPFMREHGVLAGRCWGEFGGSSEIRVFRGPVADAARGAEVLLGLGGTGNQICAGLGVPVVSVDDPGKRVQKKLIGDGEVLVPRDPARLADELEGILSDPALRERMSRAGMERMGSGGALDGVVDWVCGELGWGLLTQLWERLEVLVNSGGSPGDASKGG
ncbi:tetraacyldisaccharide 4''-kinase [Thermanaerovibrio velox DSM 12556]|uniref:Tetraacyldisaccharide 4'-kinase n=1 Tax=Thermanaerovibrio velox DSM 12556 TaxID=926567 RepID=H0UQ13_9BACT|nr:tetraacyldisaccharide 4'-kinase [Thermanaerovibrio velox]EHM09642.1 tetraacyldisaccharide 4''-kinase [Thermanaerovibrio velox DSM 12556]